MNIKSYGYLVALTLSLSIFGCSKGGNGDDGVVGGGGGGGCIPVVVADFSVDTETAETGEPHSGDGTATIFSIAPLDKKKAPLATLFNTPITFSMFPQVHARTPAPCIYSEKITAISVRSSNDIDEKHPAGSLLNDLLRVDANFSWFMARNSSGERPVAGSIVRNLNDVFPITPLETWSVINFHFAKPVNSAHLHRFTIDIHLDTGATYTVETEAVDLSTFKASPPLPL